MGEWQVRLGDIEFLTTVVPDERRLPWVCILRSLSGWDDRSQDATDPSPHPSGIGQVAGATATAARQISIEAEVRGMSGQGAASPRAGLDAIARIARAPFIVSEDARAIVRLADVRVTQAVSSRIWRCAYQLTLTLTADDPLRYSAESRALTNGTVLLPNRGDATAFGRLALTAPHGAISITHPGGVWTFPALTTGSRLVDFRELRVWNGNARVFGEGAGPAPRVLPGGSSWTVSGLGAGAAVLSRAEAWS